MEVIKTAHSVYQLQYHVIWVCQYRRSILKPSVCLYLEKLLAKLVQNVAGVQIKTIDFDSDYVHMVMTIPPKYSIASVIERLKSQSASGLRKHFSWLNEGYWKKHTIWSSGYFISGVSVDDKTIKNYVERQGQENLSQLRMEL